MRKILFLVFLSSALCVQLLYSQNKMTAQAAEKAAFLAKAPPRVQEYYRVFDSLASTPQNEPAYKKWSLKELKKYASLVNDASDYDPIAKKKLDINRYQVAKEANIGYVTYDSDVIQEIEKKISKKHARIINNAYWLMIRVDDIASLPYYLRGNLDEGIKEYRIQGRILKIWKGSKAKVNDVITCYYLSDWNYGNLIKGNLYIVALFPVVKDDESDCVKYALGGPSTIRQSIFPVENGFVIDEDDLFKLSTKIETGKFEEILSSTIKQIKSWKEVIQ